MRNFLITLLLLVCAAHTAQADTCDDYLGYPVTPLPEARPERIKALSQSLSTLLQNKDVVMLGEPSHGDGASISLRAELVQVLHQDFGFDVLIFEGDFYSLTFGWRQARQSGRIGQFARDQLYAFWSKTPAAASLWGEIEASQRSPRPITVAGMDIRMGGRLSREQLPAKMIALGRSLQLPMPAEAVRALRDLLERDLAPTAPPEAQTALLDWSASVLRKLQPGSQDAQLLRSIQAGAHFAWRNESRDAGMADNLRWLTDHYFAGRKVIVWAHSNHILRNEQVWQGVQGASEGSLPRHVGNFYSEGREDRVAVIGTVASEGVISAGFPEALQWRPMDLTKIAPIAPRSADSLEHHLASSCRAPSLLVMDRHRLDPPRFKASAIDHFAEITSNYAAGFDALLFEGASRDLNVVSAFDDHE